ncbi:MAG: hypothetical protein QXF44_02495 [Candidatus Bathyarchaeia archaeon]
MRGKSFFLIFLLVSLINLPLAFPQEVDYVYVSVEISGRNVIFLGETVSINVAANVTPVHLMIYAPNEEVVYDVWVEANSTTQFTPSWDVYGLYTVKALCGDVTTETWFWMQNLKGMAVAPSQSVWVWKGVTYNLSTVFEAGKISTYLLTASYEGKSFSVEWLSEVFTKLKPTEVKLESNGECWHIKTYSAKNKIDSWIMNTWFGVKIRVNGTLEKETTFKWNFKNVYDNILWQLDGIRLRADSANLIFDYSDMASRSVGCTYTLDKTNMKLDVYLQPNFDIDPTIFQDGFESGDFSAWDYTAGEPEVVNTTNHHGAYCLKAGAEWDYVAKAGLSQSDTLYVRGYFKFSALPANNGDFVVFMHLRNSNYADLACTYLRKDENGVQVVGILDFGSWENSEYAIILNVNQWYCFELKYYKHTTNGELRLYLNGTEVCTLLNRQFVDRADIINVGWVMGPYYTGIIHADCIVVADTYIGPEGAQYSRDASQYATFSFVTARTATLQRTATQNLGTTFISQPLSMLGRVGQQLMGFTFTSQSTINSIRSAEQNIDLSLFAWKMGSFIRPAQQSISAFFSVDRFGNFIRYAVASLTFALETFVEKIGAIIREATVTFSLIFESGRNATLQRFGIIDLSFTSITTRLAELLRQVSETLSFTFSGLGCIPMLIEVFASLALQFSTSNFSFIVNPYYASKTLVFAVGGFAFIMAIVALAFSAKRWREKKEETEEEY